MKEESNHYQAPESAIAEDFISVEPLRRSTGLFVSASICYGFAAFFLVIEILFLWSTIDLWLRAGTRAENHPTRFRFSDLCLLTMGASVLHFALAGRSIWNGKGNRGGLYLMIAFALVVLTFLMPVLMPFRP